MYILEEKERNDRLKRNWLIVLVLAFLLSHTFLFRFDLTNGFKFTGVWTHFLTPILGFGQQFDSIIVTSAIIGYMEFRCQGKIGEVSFLFRATSAIASREMRSSSAIYLIMGLSTAKQNTELFDSQRATQEITLCFVAT